jgi:hypothetical protein
MNPLDKEDSMFRRRRNQVPYWALTGGAAGLGAGAAVLAVLRTLRHFRGRSAPTAGTPLEALEDAAVDALRRDPQAGVCAIDVAAVAPGIVELSGVVPNHAVARHAAQVLESISEVRTVISRLEVGTIEEHLARNRDRLARGEPALEGRRWYGVRVGTGRRRQSPATDPPRPDDSLQRRTRGLEVESADLSDSAPSRPAPRAPGGEGHAL